MMRHLSEWDGIIREAHLATLVESSPLMEAQEVQGMDLEALVAPVECP